MSRDDDRRMRHAAYTATRLLPPAIAELVSRDLMAWSEFGYRLDKNGRAWRVVADLEDLARQREQERAFAGTASEVHR
jgi:hypothetical protein